MPLLRPDVPSEAAEVVSQSLDTKAVTSHHGRAKEYSNKSASERHPKFLFGPPAADPDDWAVVALGKQRKGWVLGFRLDRTIQPLVECAKCGGVYRVGPRASTLGSLGAHQQGEKCKRSPMGRWYLDRDERERKALQLAFGRFWLARFRGYPPERREFELDRARAFAGLKPRLPEETPF